MSAIYGYDGLSYDVGDRVELHPATNLWMRGARYGTVESISPLGSDRVYVRIDATDRIYSGSADQFRKVS